MALKKPLVLNSGRVEQIQTGDTLDATSANVDAITLASEEITDATTIGMAVYPSSTGKFKQAKADATGTKDVIGLCRAASIAAGLSGDIQLDGPLSVADWTSIIGAATLTTGSIYYLSGATKGLLTATAPVTGWVVEVGIALSTLILQIKIRQPVKL